MRAAVWFSHYGFPDTPLNLPYQTRSPVLNKKVFYETKKDIYRDINLILHEKGTIKFGIGQSLYFQMPLFCDAKIIISDWCLDMIKDYFLTTKYNIPLGKDLDSIKTFTEDCFAVIESEINNIVKYENKKDGN